LQASLPVLSPANLRGQVFSVSHQWNPTLSKETNLILIDSINIGVIKELAPIKGAETDEILGVNEFHTKYFLDHPLYLDSERAFYSALGIDLIY
jgi:hypothetical protein